MFPIWFQAGFWGFIAGSALLLGTAIGYFIKIPQKAIAAIMAFGAGVLISALSFELMDEAYRRGGFDSTAIGFLAGAVIYSAGGIAIASSLAAVIGYVVFRHFSAEIIAATTAIAAGGILAMITDTMIPEAFEQAHNLAGLITVLGFLTAFVLSKI
jgi:zinc transporter ZupT